MVRPPTHGELLRTVADLMKENKADWVESGATINLLGKRVDRLEQETQALRSRLDKNSKNSSKPPSSDSFKKPASLNRSLRESSLGAQEKQSGRAGASFPTTATSDRVLRHELADCRGCGSSLLWFPGLLSRNVTSLMCLRSRWRRWSISGFRSCAAARLSRPVCSQSK